MFFIWFGATLSGNHYESRRTNDLLARSLEFQKYSAEAIRYHGELAINRAENVGPAPLRCDHKTYFGHLSRERSR